MSSCLTGNLRLAWHDHGSELVQLASDLCGQSELTDVTLSCSGGVTFNAHRLVLAGASSYFRSMFMGVRDAWKHPVIFLRDVEPSEMEYFMQFIYNGEVSVPAKELENLIEVARSLGIKGFEKIGNASGTPRSSGSSGMRRPSSSSNMFAAKKRSLATASNQKSSGSLVKKIRLKQEEVEEAEETLEFNPDDEDVEDSSDPLNREDAGEKSDEEDAEQVEGEQHDDDETGNDEEQDAEQQDTDPNGAEHQLYTGEEDGDNTVEMLESTKGSDKVAMNGFQYVLGKKYLNHLAWRCTVRTCKGLINSDLYCLQAQLKKAHHHPPNHLAVERVKAMNRLKKTAVSCTLGPSEILKDFFSDVPPEVVTVLPSKDSLVRSICKMRQTYKIAMEKKAKLGKSKK